MTLISTLHSSIFPLHKKKNYFCGRYLLDSILPLEQINTASETKLECSNEMNSTNILKNDYFLIFNLTKTKFHKPIIKGKVEIILSFASHMIFVGIIKFCSNVKNTIILNKTNDCVFVPVKPLQNGHWISSYNFQIMETNQIYFKEWVAKKNGNIFILRNTISHQSKWTIDRQQLE